MRAKLSGGSSERRAGMRKVAPKKRSNNNATKERALVSVMRKQGMRSMEVEGVTMIKEDESLVVFDSPKLLLSPKGAAFVIQGKSENKSAAEGLSHLLSGLNGGLSPTQLQQLQALMAQASKGGASSGAGGLGSGVASFDTEDDEDGVEADKPE
jgi:hypothetical protein